MALYDSMFKVYGMGSGQVLINIPDLQQVAFNLDTLLSLPLLALRRGE